MRIEAKNIPLAAGVAAGSFLLRFFLYYDGILITDDPASGIYSALFFTAAGIMPFSHVFRMEKFRTAQLYFDSFTLSLLILTFILLLSPVAVPVIAATLLLYVLLMWRTYGQDRSSISRSAVYAVSMILLLTVAGIIRFGAYDPSFQTGLAGSSVSLKHILVFSIYNNENPLGVPFYFAGGVVIQGMSSILTLSIQSIIIYGMISAFLTENYYLIISYAMENKRGFFRGAASAVTTAFSCQCETISAALPGLSLIFLSVVSLLLLSEGFAVLLFTYLVISRLFRKGRDAKFLNVHISKEHYVLLASALSLLVAIPITETLGIMYSLMGNLIFLMGTGILMFSEGAAIVYLVREILGGIRVSRSLHIPLVLISSVAMFVWYVPLLLYWAGTVPGIFLIMNASSVLSGALAGLVYLSIDHRNRLLLAEYTFMMFSMAAIVVFYFSVIRNQVLWPYFGLQQQTAFSIILVAVSLPLTVLNTNLSLNSYAEPTY